MSMKLSDLNLHSTHGFAELLASSSDWRTIDDLVSICDEASYWESDFESRAMANAKKSQIRRVISKLKDKDGFPLFPSITITSEDGVKKRVYKQETLFDVEDYKTIVTYHANRSNHHRDMAKGYAQRCEQRHQVQLSLWDLGEEPNDEIDAEWTETGTSSPGIPR